jgi:hypothetical protein
MHPKQMRLTSSPVFPSLVNFIAQISYKEPASPDGVTTACGTAVYKLG